MDESDGSVLCTLIIWSCLPTKACLSYPAVVIGFQENSTSVNITEGGSPQMICAEVKVFGLQLDRFDSVPLNIQAEMGINRTSRWFKSPLSCIFN